MTKKILAWFLIIWVIGSMTLNNFAFLVEKGWLVTFSDWVIAIVFLILAGIGWIFALDWAYKETEN